MSDRELDRARQALSDGDELAALDALLAAWREVRARELAELVEMLSARLDPHVQRPSGKLEVFQVRWLATVQRGRAVDYPALLETVLHDTRRSGNQIVEAFGARCEAIAAWPADPRTGSKIRAHLHSGSFGAMSKNNQPAWRRIFALVLAHDDPRGFEPCDFTKMFRGWNDVAARIAFMQPAVDELVAQLKARHPKGAPALPRPLAKSVAAVRKAIANLTPVTDEFSRELSREPARQAPAPVRVAAGRSPKRDGAPSLAAASRALANGKPEAALDALLDAWRATRSSRLGELIAELSQRIAAPLPAIDGTSRAEIQHAWLEVARQRRPADLPRLMSSITHTHYRATDALARLRALDGWPADPRAALGAIENLERITFHATSTKPFWSALIAFAASHGDRRAADALAGVGKRIKSILRAKYTDLTAMQNWFAKQIAAAVAQMPPDVPLDPAATTTCERVAEQIRAVTDRGTTLLAEIVAKPGDDQLRQVYADHLQEQGDPRGELIALQLAGTDLERQHALLDKHGGSWQEPLAAIAWTEGTVFARGFPDEVWLNDARNTDALQRAVGHPIWATVRRLHLSIDQAPVELLRHPVMRSLEHVGAYEPEPILEILAWDRVPYRSLGIDHGFGDSKAAQRALLAAAPRLAALREIELGGSWFETPKAARWLLDAPLGKRLERVCLAGTCGSLGAWVKALEPSPIKAFRFAHGGRKAGAIDLVRDRKKRLAVARVQIGDELTYGYLCWMLDTLETLSELHVSGPPPKPADRKRLDKLRARFGLEKGGGPHFHAGLKKGRTP